MFEYYRRDGTPYDGPDPLMEWAADFEKQELRIVAQKKLWWGGFVSTVWLGMDHSFGMGSPLIFETMFFGVENIFIQERYTTLDEAEKGHEAIVKKCESLHFFFFVIYKKITGGLQWITEKLF